MAKLYIPHIILLALVFAGCQAPRSRCVCSCAPRAQLASPSVAPSEYDWLADLRRRLVAEGRSGDAESIANDIASLQSPSAEELSRILARLNLRSRVTFMTRPKIGARIVFQLVTSSTPQESKMLTPSEEYLPIGVYRVWAEREGVPTTKPIIFKIIERECEIEIFET